MIPLWSEDSNDVAEMKKCGCYCLESCIFCDKPCNTWHENTNNPICIGCAKVKKVSDISLDNGQRIRADKRNGRFNRGDSKRVN